MLLGYWMLLKLLGVLALNKEVVWVLICVIDANQMKP